MAINPSTSSLPDSISPLADDQQYLTTYLRPPLSQASPSMSLPSSSVSLPPADVSEIGDPPTALRRWRSNLNAWSWEIILLVFSAGLLASVFVALGQQDGKLSQGWTLPLDRNLSLNTLVAILSTFLRASMVAIAASIISQGKWVWYWDETVPARTLQNLQHFEDASRGIWGALRLLPIVLRHSVAALLAALIIILSFAIGPFVQQSIRTVAQEIAVEGQMSSLPVTYSMKITSDNWFHTTTETMFNAQMKGLIISTLGSPFAKDSNISAECSTGNCNFPSWENKTAISLSRFINAASVGVCNSCLDATALTTNTVYTYNDTEIVQTYLPNGLKIERFNDEGSIAFTSGDLSWADQLYDHETRALSRWAYVNITVLSYSLRKQDRMSHLQEGAMSIICSLYPCLRAYSAFVKDGKLNETILQSTPLYPDVGGFTGNVSDAEAYWIRRSGYFPETGVILAAVQEPCRVEDTIYIGSNISQFHDSDSIMIRLLDPYEAPNYPVRVVPRQCLFRVGASFFGLLGSFLTIDLFANSTCSWQGASIWQDTSIECMEKWWLGQFWEDGNATTDTIKTRFAAIADSLTAQMRLGFCREPGSRDHIAGTTLQTVPFTVIAWPWLIFPTVMLLVETFVLLGMIVGTSRGREDEMVWKSNLLPFVFHHDRFLLESREEMVSATNGTKMPHEPLQTAQEMEKEAKQMNAKFTRHGADEWGQRSGGKP